MIGPLPQAGQRCPRWDAAMAGFLADEAAALDDGRHQDWLDHLHEDFHYEVPVPVVREDPALPRHSGTAVLFEATKGMFRLKLGRAGMRHAWADRPGPRTRRFVSAVRVFEAGSGAVRADSHLLVAIDGGRDRALITAGREDVLVPSGASWSLLRRRVLLDVEVPTHLELSIVF